MKAGPLLVLALITGCIPHTSPAPADPPHNNPALLYRKAADNVPVPLMNSIETVATTESAEIVSLPENSRRRPEQGTAQGGNNPEPPDAPTDRADADNAAGLENSTNAMTELMQTVYEGLGLSADTPFGIVDAVALGMRFNRNIQISSADYHGALGTLEIERGAFDLSLTTSANRLRDYSNDSGLVQADTTNFSATLSRLFRNGIQVNVGEEATAGKYTSSHGASRQSESNLSFRLAIPLLKGRGSLSAAANETSAALELEAAAMTTEHAVSSAVKTIVDDYWDYLLSLRLLALAVEAECRSEKILEDTRELVKREAKPRSLLSSLKADLATKRGERYARAQSVFQSRNQLAVDIGIPVRNAVLLPVASMAFPEFEVEHAHRLVQNQDRLYTAALANRKDLQADQLALESDTILTRKAERDLLPELNLTLGNNRRGWYDGSTTDDLLDAFDDADAGYTVGLTLMVPFQNSTARGALRVQSAQRKRKELSYRTSREQIYSDVTVAARALYQACAQLIQNREAETNYRQALSDEILSFRLDKSTILDVMDAQDRLNTALSSVASAEATVAKAIATLRYQTGTLFDTNGETERKITESNFITPPKPETD